MTRASDPDAATALLRLPEFRALIAARGLAALGMSAIATVVAFQTYETTGEPLALGLLGLVDAIPALGRSRDRERSRWSWPQPRSRRGRRGAGG